MRYDPRRSCALLFLLLPMLACGEAEPPPDHFLFPTGVYELTIKKATGDCQDQKEQSTAIQIPINSRSGGATAIITFVFYRYDASLQRTVTDIGHQDFQFADLNSPSKDWSTSTQECGEVHVAATHALDSNKKDSFLWSEKRSISTDNSCDHRQIGALCHGTVTYSYRLLQACGDGCEAGLIANTSEPLKRGKCGC